MASLLIVVARAGLLALILFVVTLFPWPDITSYLSFIEAAINKLYFLNPLLDMDTAFVILGLSIIIEVLWYSYKLVRGLVLFISSGSFGSHTDNSDPESTQ